MIKILSVIFLTILTSFYFFPFEFTFLPGINTKMALAGFGVILLLFQLAKRRESPVNKDFFVLSIWAVAVSLICLLAVVWNDTNDYTYATYIVSMWVWLMGAYVVIQSMKAVHGYVTVRLVCNYLILVCVVQCLIAFTMDQYQPLKDFVDSFLAGGGFMGKLESRMYGIGAALDVAGSRFSVILVMIVYLLIDNVKNGVKKYTGLYLGAFMIIAVIGNMIGRTTTVGLLVGLAYLLYNFKDFRLNEDNAIKYIAKWLLGVCVIFVPLVIYLYNTNLQFYLNFRFAFEGFFSLVETGRWEVSSNEILKSMYVFPETLKTWIIGDGYITNPIDTDPYYTGKQWLGFYMGTDVGYLRFIFYFGLLGLVPFIIYFCKAAQVVIKRFPAYRTMFLLILAINYIVWLKVSTDIFLVFALFLWIKSEENDETHLLHPFDLQSRGDGEGVGQQGVLSGKPSPMGHCGRHD